MPEQAVHNAGDRQQVKKAEKREKRIRDREIEDLRWILNDKRGRRFLWRLLGICGVNRTSMTGDNWTFFHEGERNVGVRMVDDITQASPEAYVLMITESKEEQNQ